MMRGIVPALRLPNLFVHTFNWYLGDTTDFKNVDNIKLRITTACHPENIWKLAHQIPQLLRNNARVSLYVQLTLVTIIWAAIALYNWLKCCNTPCQSRSPHEKAQPVQTDSGKNKFAMEKPGVWKPSDFTRPPALPYPNWSVTKTKPLPYRPFQPKYFTTLGLRNMNWDEWIELDNHYMKFHSIKMRRISEGGDWNCRTDPEAFDGAVELVEEFCGYLPERYPSLYRKTDVGMDNIVTGESFNIIERPLKEDPMQMAARMVQDDLAIMFEKEDGQYYLLAGSVLLARFWRLKDKWRMPLSEIHTSGDVPQFKEKLEYGMMKFFRRLSPESPMLRYNYFIQIGDDLAWNYSIGDEDDRRMNCNTSEKNRAVQHYYFRSERQSLRRLPRSGGVVFTIRTYFHPITEICEEPYVPGRLASAVRSWPDDIAIYRGRAQFQEALLEYLDKKHKEQLANGLVLEKEDKYHQYPY